MEWHVWRTVVASLSKLNQAKVITNFDTTIKSSKKSVNNLVMEYKIDFNMEN